MRLGVATVVGDGAGAVSEAPATVAAEAEDAGLDLILLEPGAAAMPAAAQALTSAAFVSARTSTLRVAVCAPIGPHPVLIAEQAAVADNASGGRLALVLSHDGSDVAELIEAAEVVLAALAPRPFCHRGARWSVPGAVESNRGERLISVMPNPAQLELPVWLLGETAPQAGRELGLSHVARSADSAELAADAWSETETALGRIAAHLRRPAIRELDCSAAGDFDHEALTLALVRERERWGVDVALLRLPRELDQGARRRAIRRLASFVRPHLQMDRVPAHVADYWRRELPGRLLED
jgi:alkanesulfonate monooxygenase SsuD/methylene tetrahydromethanopterin reductase-like flavin-dependent oxidoreductase (luciferase family)